MVLTMTSDFSSASINNHEAEKYCLAIIHPSPWMAGDASNSRWHPPFAGYAEGIAIAGRCQLLRRKRFGDGHL